MHQVMSKSSDTNFKHLSSWDVNMSNSLQPSKPTRLNQVHTTIGLLSNCDPPSAPSGSSIASSSPQSSPIMSPDTAIHTTSSSIQASPELMPILDEDGCSPNFQLPESIVSRKASSNSIGQTLLNHSQATSETTGSNSTVTAPPNPKSSLIRRLSSRASRRISNRRRQSSVAPASRDTSLGPCLLRRRSDSNTTAPPDFPAVAVDSESDIDEIDDLHSLMSLSGLDSAVRGSSANSTTGSVNGLSNTMAAPVIPTELLHGAWVTKVSKKNRAKKVCLVYDQDSCRLSWDKTRPNKFVHMDEILAVRSGTDVQQYGIDLNLTDVTTMFTIIYTVPKKADNSNNKMMHLLTDNLDTCNAWIGFLDAMLRHRQEVMESLMSFDEGAIAHYWHSEMTRQHGEQPRTEAHAELDISAVKRLCQNLHIYNSVSILEKNFQQADIRNRGRLNFSEFLDFVRKTNQRPDIRRIIHSIAHQPDLGITLDEFLYFLREIQKEDVDSNLHMWEKKFSRLAARKPRSDHSDDVGADSPEVPRMCEAAFVSFVASKQNGPLKEEPQSYTLDHPLNDYFISSSHNTYLLGRQVKGQSSIEGYITALVQGCRCVEVDSWDGSDGQPQVVHGRTLTTAISFREVIAAINKYAFVKTLQMLTISIENHCSPAQQQIMYDIMKEIFGSRLIEEPLDMMSKSLPPPCQVQERIAIKVKVPVPEEHEPAQRVGRRRGNSLNSLRTQAYIPEGVVAESSQGAPQSPMLTPSPSTRRLASKARVNTIAEGGVSDLLSSDNESGSDTARNGRSSNKTVPVLGKLGVYFAGVKFSGFDSPDAKKFNHIFSFMESSFSKHSRAREDKTALDLHNMRHMMRVYPDGIRLSSSNFDPLIYWRRGVQMAALNWQTNDLGMQLNRAMFEGGTDSSGYVLKPEALRGIQVGPLDDNIVKGKRKHSRVSFSIDVLSAQQLMRPANLAHGKAMNPYVEIEVFDGRAFEPKAANLAREFDSPLKVQTEPIRDNGFNPMFNNGRFKFQLTTKYPELVFVKFTVKLSMNGESYNHKDHHGVASWMVKLNNLKDGYRTIPLENHEGVQYLFSTLFCKIQRHPDDGEVYVADASRRTQEGNKLKSLGEKVFGRMNTSPRTTVDKSSFEKSSFEQLSS